MCRITKNTNYAAEAGWQRVTCVSAILFLLFREEGVCWLDRKIAVQNRTTAKTNRFRISVASSVLVRLYFDLRAEIIYRNVLCILGRYNLFV